MKKAERPGKLKPVEVSQISPTDITNKETKMKSLAVAAGNNSKANNSIEGQSKDPMATDKVMIVLDKFKVETEFFELVELEFGEIYPFLLEDAEYSPQDLVGEPLWNDLTSLAQRQAISCLKHLATLPGARLTDLANGCFLPATGRGSNGAATLRTTSAMNSHQ
jgi:hypothetical protein